MSALGLLFADTLRRDRVRLICALLGVAAAAALLTWSVGLAETTNAQCRPLSETMGRPFDCWVSTGRASAAAPKGTGMQTLSHGSPFKMIPAPVVEAVKASPDIETLLATTVFRCRLDWRPDGRPLQGPGVGGGISPVRDFPVCPYPDGLAAGRWPRADAGEPEFVISPFAFGVDGLKDCPPVGTRIPVVTPTGSVVATLCGYLAETIRPVSGFPTLFASDNLADAAALAETGGGCNLMLICLKSFRSPEALAETVRTVSPDDDAAMLVTRRGLLRQLRSDAIGNLLFQLPLLVALACVATLCMIVNALCVGIEQNRLRHARLRAMGMTVGQLSRLVASEGIFLTGMGGILGGLAGVGLLAAFVCSKPLVFPDGLSVGWVTVAAVGVLLTLSTGLALIVPLRRAARLRPGEMRAAPEIWHAAHPVARMAFAVICLLPVLFTVVRFSPSPFVRSFWFLLVGLPLAVMGLLLAVKPLMALCEYLLARLLGGLLGLRAELLRGTLMRSADRNARMVLTLTAGLGAFFAIHIWGASLTDPFIPSRDLPPAIVSLLPNGISRECLGMLETAGVAELGGVASKNAAAVDVEENGGAQDSAVRVSDRTGDARSSVFIPFSAEQYRLQDEDFAAIGERAGALPRQNNVLLVATEGETGVTVTEMFARQCRVRVGDTFRIQRKDADGTAHTLPLTVTGIVRCNWHLVTARAQLRARNGAPFATLGPVFVGAEVAKAWDPGRNARVRFLWLQEFPPFRDTEGLYSATELLERRLQAIAGADPQPYRPRRSWAGVPGVRSSASPAAKTVPSVEMSVASEGSHSSVSPSVGNVSRAGISEAPDSHSSSSPAVGSAPSVGASAVFPNVVVHLRDEISDGTLAHSAELLGSLARIPLWSLLILCSGFVSLLAANVRAMAGELRTLHAVGMTRGQIGRFLFAQVLMLCVVTAVLSLTLGLTIGWGFTGWTLAWMPFGGLPTVLVLPWARIGEGSLVLLAVTLVITPLPIVFLIRRLLRR